MTSFTKLALGALSIVLFACSNDGKSSDNAISQSTDSTPTGDRVVLTILNAETKGNPSKPEQGFGCSIGMSIENKSDKKLQLVQILEYSIETKAGAISGRQSNFKLPPHGITKRAGIYAKNTECKDIETLQIKKFMCMYATTNPTNDPALKCHDKASLHSNTSIKFIQASQN